MQRPDVDDEFCCSNGKVALITGVTGQDGAYLSELLLSKGYAVHGIKRRSSSFNTGRIEHLYQDPHVANQRFILHYGDMTDSTNLIRIVQQTQPDEIYNLAAQSHVQVSFETPEYTANADGIGTLRLLEAIRILGLEKKTRFYQASTSELFGQVQEIPQTETTPFYPRSPYAAAKLYAYWITVNYREAYGMHASNGILFNHESPMRGETFVTRKITRAVAAIQLGMQEQALSRQSRRQARLGSCARICPGHVADAAAGRSPTITCWRPARRTQVRKFVEWAFAEVGIDIEWAAKASTRRASTPRPGACLVEVDPRYFRPTEVDLLIGDPAKAHAKLGWRHETSVARTLPRNGPRRPQGRWRGGDRDAEGGVKCLSRLSLAGKRVWVAGHRGMVGSALVRRLAREDCEVLTVDARARSICATRREVDALDGERRDPTRCSSPPPRSAASSPTTTLSGRFSL